MFKKFCILLFLIGMPVHAQNFSDSLNSIRESYKAFNYVEVIKKSVDVLLQKEKVPHDNLIEIYMLKGSSHFTLQEDTLAKYSFMEILKIDSAYVPDSISISPKIVKFFNEVKSSYKIYTTPEEVKSTDDSLNLYNHNILMYNKNLDKFKNSIYRSFLFPGLGHMYLGDKKGWYFTIAGAISLSSSVYFIIRTNHTRSEYLNASNPATIIEMYDKYNDAYKLRNISIAAFGAVWLFSQIDLISFMPEIPLIPSDMQLIVSPLQTNLTFRIPF